MNNRRGVAERPRVTVTGSVVTQANNGHNSVGPKTINNICSTWLLKNHDFRPSSAVKFSAPWNEIPLSPVSTTLGITGGGGVDIGAKSPSPLNKVPCSRGSIQDFAGLRNAQTALA